MRTCVCLRTCGCTCVCAYACVGPTCVRVFVRETVFGCSTNTNHTVLLMYVVYLQSYYWSKYTNVIVNHGINASISEHTWRREETLLH